MKNNKKLRRLPVIFQDISLVAICFFPILKFNIATILIVAFAVIGIISFYGDYLRGQGVQRDRIKYFLMSSSFLILLILTLPYTSNFDDGIGRVQRGLSIIIFPALIILFNKGIPRKKVEMLLYVFCAVCVITSLYVYVELLSNDVFDLNGKGTVEFWSHPYREALLNLELLDLHPSYFSLWILFCALFLINELFERKTIAVKLLQALLVTFFLVTAVVFSSRAPLIGFVLAAFLLLLLKLKTPLSRTLTSLFVVVLVLAATTQISFLKSRFIDEFNAQRFIPPVGAAHTSTNIRVGIYKCAWQIFNEYPFTGVGVGDVMEQLNLCYKQFHTRVYEETDYNTHSSYLNLLLSGGIFTLFLFLASLFYQLRFALKTENHIYFAFLVLVMVALLFENVFSRMYGALFYGLFNAVLLNNSLLKTAKRQDTSE